MKFNSAELSSFAQKPSVYFEKEGLLKIHRKSRTRQRKHQVILHPMEYHGKQADSLLCKELKSVNIFQVIRSLILDSGILTNIKLKLVISVSRNPISLWDFSPPKSWQEGKPLSTSHHLKINFWAVGLVVTFLICLSLRLLTGQYFDHLRTSTLPNYLQHSR